MTKEAEAFAARTRVKDLDWRSLMDETFIAETVLGIYRIEDDGALFTEDRFRLYLAPNVAKAQKHPSLASAKAAAQADFDRRILSCIEPQATDAAMTITGMDEYGPMMGWYRPWTDFEIGTQFVALAPKPKVEERV